MYVSSSSSAARSISRTRKSPVRMEGSRRTCFNDRSTENRTARYSRSTALIFPIHTSNSSGILRHLIQNFAEHLLGQWLRGSVADARDGRRKSGQIVQVPAVAIEIQAGNVVV